jgi:hypothetical protein
LGELTKVFYGSGMRIAAYLSFNKACAPTRFGLQPRSAPAMETAEARRILQPFPVELNRT